MHGPDCFVHLMIWNREEEASQPAFLQQALAKVEHSGNGYGSASLVRDELPYMPRSLQCSCNPLQNRTSPRKGVLVANLVRFSHLVPNLQ